MLDWQLCQICYPLEIKLLLLLLLLCERSVNRYLLSFEKCKAGNQYNGRSPSARIVELTTVVHMSRVKRKSTKGPRVGLAAQSNHSIYYPHVICYHLSAYSI